MNFAEQEKKFAELQEQFESLNKQFEQTMAKNNFTDKDLNIDEKDIPAEVLTAWNKMKSDIEASAKANAETENPSHASKAGTGRRNAIRL